MKSRLVLSGLLCASSLLLAQDVKYNYDPSANFSKYHTYQWVVLPTNHPDQLIDRQIKEDVDGVLAAKGLTKVDSNPDIQVGYQIAVDQEKQWNAWGTGGFRFGGGMASQPNPRSASASLVSTSSKFTRKGESMLTRHIDSIRVGVFALLCVLAVTPAFGQERSQYLSGINAVNSGMMPDAGFSYSNIFYDDTSDRLKGPKGGGIAVSGQFAIFVDNNIFLYVYKPKILGGNLESMADITVANANLGGNVFRPGLPGVAQIPINGGGGGLANCHSMLSTTCPFVKGQSSTTETQAWPEADLHVQFASNLRVLALAGLQEAYGYPYHQWYGGAALGYQFKRIGRKHLESTPIRSTIFCRFARTSAAG
jgi:Domain of unknown function (DUF4136)